VTVLALPLNTESVPAARRFVRDRILDGDTVADLDTASLLVTELVTNAVLHAVAPMTLRVEVSADVVRIEVRDGSQLPPRVHAFSAMAATGRGLRLLESLAVRWGVRPEPDGGKVVWFEVGASAESAWEIAAGDRLGDVVLGDL
jgi:anti-sigma regulatory factor (Ser/Thr protein kinase)